MDLLVILLLLPGGSAILENLSLSNGLLTWNVCWFFISIILFLLFPLYLFNCFTFLNVYYDLHCDWFCFLLFELFCRLATRITKKKKLKINVHRPVGTRVVFDEEGNTLPPLARLAASSSGADSVQLNKEKGITDISKSLKSFGFNILCYLNCPFYYIQVLSRKLYNFCRSF